MRKKWKFWTVSVTWAALIYESTIIRDELGFEMFRTTYLNLGNRASAPTLCCLSCIRSFLNTLESKIRIRITQVFAELSVLTSLWSWFSWMTCRCSTYRYPSYRTCPVRRWTFDFVRRAFFLQRSRRRASRGHLITPTRVFIWCFILFWVPRKRKISREKINIESISLRSKACHEENFWDYLMGKAGIGWPNAMTGSFSTTSIYCTVKMHEEQRVRIAKWSNFK